MHHSPVQQLSIRNDAGTATRRMKDRAGRYSQIYAPLQAADYNQYMGGVDTSDQLIGYHHIVRQRKRYWKTLFYHLLEVSMANAFVLHKWLLMEEGTNPPTESKFRDEVILAIIKAYSMPTAPLSTKEYRVCHGSRAYGGSKYRCRVCHKRSNHQYPDCPFLPSLCQLLLRDYHRTWHSPEFHAYRHEWFRDRGLLEDLKCQQRGK